MDTHNRPQLPSALVRVERLEAACKKFVRHYVEAQARDEFRDALRFGLDSAPYPMKSAARSVYYAAEHIEVIMALLTVEKPDCLAIRASAERLRTTLTSLGNKLRHH